MQKYAFNLLIGAVIGVKLAQNEAGPVDAVSEQDTAQDFNQLVGSFFRQSLESYRLDEEDPDRLVFDAQSLSVPVLSPSNLLEFIDVSLIVKEAI